MMSRRDEVVRLSQADRNIAVAEHNITDQQLLLERLRADGYDTKGAEKMLASLQRTLRRLKERRAAIAQTIAQIDDGLM